MSRIILCHDCDERIDTREAYGLLDKSGYAVCIDCCDYHYDVTLIDAGEAIEGVSTWTGNGPKVRREERIASAYPESLEGEY